MMELQDTRHINGGDEEAAQTRQDLEAILEIIDQRIYELTEGNSSRNHALTQSKLSALRKSVSGFAQML